MRDKIIQELIDVLKRNNVKIEKSTEYDGEDRPCGQTVEFFGETFWFGIDELIDAFKKTK